MNKQRYIIGYLLFLMGGVMLSSAGYASAKNESMQKSPAAAIPATAAKPADTKKAKSQSTADHSKFKELDKNFKTGPEVTKACLTCHTEAAKQVHLTKHWTWEFINPATKRKLGKKNVINNFCTSTKTNQTFCSACHIGYGWKDDKFDFTKEAAVDCLACHDTTKSYKKIPGFQVIQIIKKWNGLLIQVNSVQRLT